MFSTVVVLSEAKDYRSCRYSCLAKPGVMIYGEQLPNKRLLLARVTSGSRAFLAVGILTAQ